MYVRLGGVTFMSDCEVTLRPSGVSLVWALNVRLVFLFLSVQRSLAWLSLFLALVFGVSAATPALGFPLELVPGCNKLIWGVTFMSDCEVTLLPSGASLVWALNVCLVFLFVSVQRSLAWLSLFLALVLGVGAASPALARPVQLAPGCYGLLYIMFV